MPLPIKKSNTMSPGCDTAFNKNATTLSGFEKEKSNPNDEICVVASSLLPTPTVFERYC